MACLSGSTLSPGLHFGGRDKFEGWMDRTLVASAHIFEGEGTAGGSRVCDVTHHTQWGRDEWRG